VSENDLVVSWLSDKLLYEVENEELALKALKVAEEKITYKITPKFSKEKGMGKNLRINPVVF
jgi:hypothetical protein